MAKRTNDHLKLLDRLKSSEDNDDWRDWPEQGALPFRGKMARRRPSANLRDGGQSRDSDDRSVSDGDWD